MRRGLLILTTAAACGGATAPVDEGGPDEVVEIVFTASPLRMQDLVEVGALGSLNPPDHTIPNDHIIFSYLDRCPCDFSPRPVYAPADGTVRLVLRGQDDGLEVGRPPGEPFSERHPWYYMGHVQLFPDIVEGRVLTAGEQIGVTGSFALGVDLGIVHPEADNYFVVRERYHAKTLYGERPLPYFVEPLRSQLYALVQRVGPDRDGRFDYDIAGRLSGGWFHESLPMDESSTGPVGWERNLAFVYWDRDPAVPVVVVGGTLLPPLVYWIDEDDPDFGDVGVASGIATYRLHVARPQSGVAVPPDHLMLVHLTTDTRLMIEVFPGDAQATGFTSNAKVYLR
jgi:hypothetical protein